MNKTILLDKQKKSILKLLDSNVQLKEILDTLDLSYSSYLNTLKSDIKFKKEILSIREKKKYLNDNDIENIINLYYQDGDIKRTLKKLNLSYLKHLRTKKVSKKYKKKLFKIKEERNKREQLLFLEIYRENLNLSETLLKTKTTKYKFKYWLSQNSFKKKLLIIKPIQLNKKPLKKGYKIPPKGFKGTNRKGSVFYKSGKVVGYICNNCSMVLPINNFYLNKSSNTGYMKTCIGCYSSKYLKKIPDRRGEFRKGKRIITHNSIGNVTHRRCTNCDNLKPLNEFDKLYNKIHVCKDCFQLIPNFHPDKRGEFDKNGNQIRIYNKLLYVIKKVCNSCGKMKDLNDFHKNNNNRIDGRVGKCKDCNKS